MILWHNPRCSKSREALKLLEDKGYEVEVFRYLDTPPSFEQLESLHKVLGAAPWVTREDVLRREPSRISVS